ncbi:MAG TPA: recombinase family protein, partial [Firmicutes bacterium]|nr:recombinase family protein [Bacillota bacterium]
MTDNNDFIESIIKRYDSHPAKSNGELKAFAWARVSTDMQDDRGASIDQQLREIRKYAENRGIEIMSEFSEVASAFQQDSKRHEFHKMLDNAKSDRTIGVILVHDMSRFSRDSIQAKMLVRELRESGIKVISLNDPEIDPESVTGVYMEAITFAKNEAYSREVSFHTKKGCRANAQTRDPETGWCYWNGGKPVWGYKIMRINRGNDRSGKPIIKSIVVPDDTIVNGKPVHEWARYCFDELAAKGASLAKLTDFCNENGIPGIRNKYWNPSTWSSLLKPYNLMTYTGYGLWNVHRKKGDLNPVQDWIIVPDAHEALISRDTAQAILDYKEARKKKHSFDRYGKSRTSPYLLSGGLFKCERCQANMVAYKRKQGVWYICGSKVY